MKLALALPFLFVCNSLMAQDTIKVVKDQSYYKNCVLEICIKNKCFTDSIPQKLFFENNNIELKMRPECALNKKSDIFVSSFELTVLCNGETLSSIAQSSFFTDPQKNILKKIKSKDTFILKNITIHAPDGFKKMEDLRFVVN